MKSSSQHTFARNPVVKIPRRSFRRNHPYKTTLDAGTMDANPVRKTMPHLHIRSIVTQLSAS